MNVVNRPSPLLATQRARVTVPFALKGSLLLAQELLESLEDIPENAEQRAEIEASIKSLMAEGYIPWQLSGTMLSVLPAVEGHAVMSLTQELHERFIKGKEGVPGVNEDRQKVSLHLLQNVATVHTAVQSIDGAEPYTPEELLSLAHNIEELWSLLLVEVLTRLGPNPM